MKFEPPMSVVHRRAGAFLWVLMVLPLASCIELGSKACSAELTCPAGLTCSADGSACILSSSSCGNGITDADEQCDDGNLREGDGCHSDCKFEDCGNHIQEAGEVCDDGNTRDGDGCSANCRSKEECGNGIVDSVKGEVCDNGNTVGGDGCSADCDSKEECGNKIIDFAVGEVCDKGDTIDGDGCSADCRSTENCGNGFEDLDEECDDQNNNNEDNCLDTCDLSRCGDGVTDKELPGTEECDGMGESPDCNFNCTRSRCGDGIVNAKAGEQCDTGGESITCNSTCTVARCGDGVVNLKAGEECDDGNSNNEDDCLTTCKNSMCGDGFVNRDGTQRREACDDGNDRDESPVDCPYGERTCNQFCNSSCSATLNLQGPFCGDGIHQVGKEICEDGNMDACGLCDPTCTRYQHEDAEGSITAVEKSRIADGKSFSLSDGLHLPKIFEFDKDDPPNVRAGRVRVPIKNAVGVRGVSDAIKDAINTARWSGSFGIQAERENDELVTLKNVTNFPIAGGRGNQRVIEDVDDPDFHVEGMSGGGGWDCPGGTRCTYGPDCASGNCTNGFCVP